MTGLAFLLAVLAIATYAVVLLLMDLKEWKR